MHIRFAVPAGGGVVVVRTEVVPYRDLYRGEKVAEAVHS